MRRTVNKNVKARLWRWTRGLGALGIGVIGIAYLAPRIASVNLETAQVGHDTHQTQGQYVVENRSDFPWTLAPARAQGGDETIELVSSETPYKPDGSRSLDVYHCFVLNPNFTRDVMVTGAEVIPGNRRIVHHAILYKVEPSQAAVVLAKDRETGGKGWDCFGGPGLTGDPRTATAGGNWLSVWVPGAGDGRFPEGIGNPMGKGSLIVMEVHYNLNNGTGEDRSKVNISVAPEGKKLTPIASQLRIAPVEIRCPDSINTPECTREYTLRENVARAGELAGRVLPNSLLQGCGQTAEQYQKPVGDASKIVSTCDGRNPTDMTLYSIGGHMHLLAKSIKIELNPGTNSAKTLLYIPKWDFHWQGNYWFKNPVQIKRGDVIRTTCVFDNSVANQPVVAGKKTNPKYVMWAEATTDEMCLGILMANVKPNS
jgi:Copper type II ascorbate-dependent monooxygenase, C-terminal domain/Copper type II ascorbate-dependent monooxygenase, N-terminal domain